MRLFLLNAAKLRLNEPISQSGSAGLPCLLLRGPFLLFCFSVAAKEATDSSTSPYREQQTRQYG